MIENRPGAGGTIAAGAVAKSAPDGTTLMVHSSGHAANAFIYPALPYDTLKDFVQVVPLAGQPNVLVTSPASGYKTVADLIADAKKRPGAVKFGSAGIGSGTHFNAEKFKLAAGIDVDPRAVQGHARSDDRHHRRPRGVLLLADLGRAAAGARRQAGGAGGQLGQRSTVLPNVPTVAESGPAGLRLQPLGRVFAPAGTPTDVIDKINRSVNRVLAEADVQARMAALGAEPMSMNPAEFDRFMRAEMDDAAKVVKAAGIKAQ